MTDLGDERLSIVIDDESDVVIGEPLDVMLDDAPTIEPDDGPEDAVEVDDGPEAVVVASLVDVGETSLVDATAEDGADVDGIEHGAPLAAEGGVPPKDGRGGPERQGARRVHWERPTRIAVASLALIAILFLFVFPTRSYLAQQRQVRSTRHSVAVLQAQNEDLEREARELQTPAEIERMARVEFDMVFPGEQAYTVISPGKPAAG